MGRKLCVFDDGDIAIEGFGVGLSVIMCDSLIIGEMVVVPSATPDDEVKVFNMEGRTLGSLFAVLEGCRIFGTGDEGRRVGCFMEGDDD